MLREVKRAGNYDEPPEPWRSFLRQLDERLTEAIELHCIGGFVVSLHYGIGRQTADIDFLRVVPRMPSTNLDALAGHGSAMHRVFGLYVQQVTITTPPEGYEQRLERMFPSAGWKHLTLHAMEAHDLALSKLERNAERDREDVLGLAAAGLLNAKTLEDRYQREQRPYLLGDPERHDLTLRLWLDMCWPVST